ncbi:cytochrome b/b6 domain-containing protein [Bryobacter aggregatus]|uniref:cytochrome b/b6 domain-containing protein n=1 Tax=Bryobacter aggregatus TaxID=360054 RepID=UPI0004E14B0C|nr:cytochrome b/b6 domain-containing protein [Bryobacter aggregatus]
MKAKHPLAIRWFHWLNFPLLAIMIWSGLLIYWANDVYIAFPDWFYEKANLSYRLADGMSYHFLFMWFFALNGIAYVIYTLWSGEWRHLVPGRGALGQAYQVILYDLHIRKEPLPPAKYNAAQQIAYTGILLMGIGSLITGLVIYRPIQLHVLTQALGGYSAVRFLHFLLTAGYVLFFFVHVAQVIRAGWPNFKAMVTGNE